MSSYSALLWQVIPLLSCWEQQVIGVYEGAEVGEAGLQVRHREQAEPWQQQSVEPLFKRPRRAAGFVQLVQC